MTRHAIVLALFLLAPATSHAAPAQHADLAVDVYVPERATAGPRLDYRVTVRNNGPDRAENLFVRFDSHPTAILIDGAICVPSPGGCRIQSLPVGASEQIVFRLTPEIREQDIDVSIKVTADQHDPDPTNNRIGGRTALTLAPSLRFNLYSGIADPGATVEYNAWLANYSDIDATNVAFTLQLPEGWSFENSLSSDLVCSSSGSSVHCSIARVPAQTTSIRKFLLRASPSESGLAYRSVPAPLTTDHGVFNELESTGYFTASAYHYLTVTTTADEGSGSLRGAILNANANCNGYPYGPCKIVFDIAADTSAGHTTIRPLTPLPVITAVVTIDGSTQTARRGDTNPNGPEVELNGALLSAGNGLEIASPNAAVSDLVINGFPYDGIRVTETGFIRTIERCFIGTDAAGRTAVPNGARGVSIESPTQYHGTIYVRDSVISGNRRSGVFAPSGGGITLMNNRIGLGPGDDPAPLGNGASGVYFGAKTAGSVVQSNVIANNADAGIAVDMQALWVAIRGNSIYANGGLAIDYGLDRSTPNENRPNQFRELANYPIITSARFDAGSGKTIIEGRVETRYVQSVALVELFANDSAADGLGEAQVFLGRVSADDSLRFSFETPMDLRGRFITSTFTAPNNYYPEVLALKTSELSPAVRVDGDAGPPFEPSDVLLRGADLSVFVSGFFADRESPAGSKQQVYVSVVNHGPGTAENATVDLALSSGAWTVSSGDCVISGLRARCTFGPIAARSTDSNAVLYAETPLDTGVQQLDASVTSTTADRILSNNSASYRTTITDKSMMTLKVLSPGSIDPGEIGTWHVGLELESASRADNVQVTIPLPHAWTLVSSESNGWQCRQESSNVVCTLATLEGLSRTTFALLLKAPESELGEMGYSQPVSVMTAQGLFFEPYSYVTFGVNRLISVTTTVDVGEGSLRDAIHVANQQCGENRPSCTLIFELPAHLARDGVFTIRPHTPLPTITSRDTMIDGRTQTKFGGDTNPFGPEVELNGAEMPEGNGLLFASLGQSGVRGLVINGFPGNGVVIREENGYEFGTARVIADNYIGTSPNGQTAVPNGGRGITIDTTNSKRSMILSNVVSGNRRSGVFIGMGDEVTVSGNRIGLTAGDTRSPLGNGASGVFLGVVSFTKVNANEIAYNRDAGLSIASSAQWNGVIGNSFFENGQLAVDHNLDSVTRNDDATRRPNLPEYPLLLAAVWDESAKVTRITGTAKVDFNGGVIEVFSNSGPDATGFGEAERTLGTLTLPSATGVRPFTFEIAEDLRGKLITATFSRGSIARGTVWTSEVSPILAVN